MAKQKVTLNKIVDVRGTVYGPGTITVAKDIADTLVQYHDAVPGEVITDDVAELMKLPVDQLTPEQLQQVMDAKAGKKPSGKKDKDEAPKAPATPPTPPQPPAVPQGQEQPPAPPAPPVQTGGLPEGFPARDKLTAAGITSVAQLRGVQGELAAILDQGEVDKVTAELALLEQ